MELSASRFAVLGTVVLLTSGCLSGGPGVDSSASPTSDLATPTPTPAGHEYAATQPAPDKVVKLENDWNRSVEMHVRIVREQANETVHEETYELAPGAARDVYDTASADPDGVEAFTVVLTARNTTERVTIETSKCYGDAYGSVLEDGTVYLYYAIC